MSFNTVQMIYSPKYERYLPHAHTVITKPHEKYGPSTLRKLGETLNPIWFQTPFPLENEQFSFLELSKFSRRSFMRRYTFLTTKIVT